MSRNERQKELTRATDGAGTAEIGSPMTPLQKKIFIIAAVAVALTRFLAVAKSFWDWDEAQFASGVTDYDVVAHHPHPPGYPLFIAAAKLIHLFDVEEFRSLQSVVVLGAIFAFPALFLLARELGFDFTTSIGGALIFSFLPNVWIYGGTGFTDVPATVLALFASCLLLKGRRSVNAYVAGAVVLAIAAGVRPATLLIGAIPGILATLARLRVSWRPVLLAALLGALISGGSYLGAALASESVANYRWAVREQSEWVRSVDSFQNPDRPPLASLAKLFFVLPVQHKDLMLPLAALAGISLVAALVRRRLSVLLTVATFAPIAILSWLQLDLSCVGRYSIAYVAAHALLTADAFRLLLRKASFQAAACVVAAVVLGAWTWPALDVMRSKDAPPAAAFKWVRANVSRSQPVFVHAGLGPLAAYALAGYRVHLYHEESELAKAYGDSYVVRYDVAPNASAVFTRERGRLWKIVRPRNFEASVAALSNVIRFGEGWYDREVGFVWMGREARVLMPRLPKQGILEMKFHAPVPVDFYFNGLLIDSTPGSPDTVEKRWILHARRFTDNELRLVAQRTVRAPGDSRDLALRLDEVSWMPAR